MKYRLFLSAIILFIAYIASVIWTPATTLTSNYAVVATVNGGDAEYIARQSINHVYDTVSLVGTVVTAVLLLVIWVPFFKNKNKNKNNNE